MKTAIYTVCTRGKDAIIDPVEITPGVDYFCFSDKVRRFKHYQNIVIPQNGCNIGSGWLGSVKIARKIKILPHLIEELKDYDQWLWIDSNIYQIKDLTQLIEMGKDFEVSAFTHGFHKNILQEYDELVRLRNNNNVFAKDPNIGDIEPMQNQIAYYKKAKLGITRLFWTGYLLRKNTERVREANEIWHSQIEIFTHRDQMSFTYAMESKGLKIKSLSNDNNCGYTNDKNFKKYLQFKLHAR